MWNEVQSILPPKNHLVMTKVEDEKGTRNEQLLHLGGDKGTLWFAGDMYVYYSPTHWRELTPLEVAKVRNENERKAIQAMERANERLGII